MISVFDWNNTNFAGNGNAVLTPIKCNHTQVAAGKYDLSIQHPIDPGGKWMHIVPEAIIRAPVPEETIETAWSGLDVDLYRTTTAAALRSGPSEPQPITYSEFSAYNSYSVGDRVTYTASTYRYNFQLTKAYTSELAPNPVIFSEYWTKIASQTSGDPVLVNLKSGTDLYYVSGPDSGWYKMATTYGMEGYIKSTYIEFVRHLSPSETQPRHITNQLFRIKTVNVDSKSRTLTATAEHVSYDLSGIMIENADIHQMTPAMALAWIEQEFMTDYRGTIATNLTSSTDGTYTGQIKGKNGIYALLDPDKGIVSSFDAMYRRDNWDLFIMRMVHADRGFRLRFRKNMLGVSWNIKSDGLITRVVPVAKAADGGDLFLDGTRWVDSAYIANFPVIRTEWLKVSGQVGKDDGTETGTTWTEETLRAEMRKKAQERFSIDKVDHVIHEITVDFEMMGDTEEYRELKDLEQVLMYDTVVVINEEIQLSVSVEVTQIEYDAIRKKIKALKLANVNEYGGRSVSGFNVFNNSITAEKLTDDAVDAVDVGGAVEEANDYTDQQIRSMDWGIRNWVQQNFEPIQQ